MSVNPRIQAAIEKAAALKMAEQGEPLTEQEISRIYIGQYMQDRKAGELDDYDPDELVELEKVYQAQQDRLLHYLAKVVSDVKAGKLDDYGDDNPEALKEIADQLLAGEKADAIKKLLDESQDENGRKYRTQYEAHKAGAAVKLQPQLPVITFKPYQFAMSLYQDKDGLAYLQPLADTENLIFNGGKMYFNDNERTREITEVELQQLKTKEGITDINLSLLRQFYSIIFYYFEQSGYRKPQDVIKIYLPRIAENLGWKPNFSKQNIDELLKRVQSFHNIVGVYHTKNTAGKDIESYFPVLNFEGYDAKENSISFSSPYMNFIINKIYKGAIQRDKKGEPKLKKHTQQYLLDPNHSFLVNSDIGVERNEAAVENVIIIVQIIEQAGNGIPNIAASTLIERNPQLQERLMNSKNKRQLLKRTFSKTWELLRDRTRLTKFYEGIGLTTDKTKLEEAEPLSKIKTDSPDICPNVGALKNTVFYFPHKGKKKDGLQGK